MICILDDSAQKKLSESNFVSKFVTFLFSQLRHFEVPIHVKKVSKPCIRDVHLRAALF